MAELYFGLQWILDMRTILVCCSVLLVISWYFRQPRSIPPGPWSWPIVGCLPNLGVSLYMSGLQPHEYLAQLADRYGKIYSLNLGGQLVVILNDARSVREAFQNQIFTDRPRYSVPKYARIPGEGVVTSSGDAWRQQRRFTLSTFRSFGVGKQSFQKQISVECQALSDEILKLQGAAFDPHTLIGNAVANIICAVVFGKRFKYTDSKFHDLLDLLNKTLRSTGSGIAEVFIPLLKYLKFSSAKTNELYTMIQTLRRFYHGILEEHREQFDSTNLQDYVDVYLDEIRQAKENGLSSHVNENNLLSTISHLFAAGSETSATALRWALLYMIANPEIQSKVQQEIDDVVGRNRLPYYTEKDQMPFTVATIMEILRISSIGPLGFPHCASENGSLGGYIIPKGTIVVSNIWGIHHDPKVWSDPEKFRPERFLCGDELGAQPEEYIPFSAGRRMCLGEDLAKMELFLFFTHLLHRFTFKKSQNSDELCFRGVLGATNSPRGFKVEAILRE